ncbi:MAG: PepSY domain-containing protein [Rhodobacterales bacterium]|nr:PepSY domain-containing protein [Rhodobacterales bacterium]MDX5500323.1 PepSY domain-containing protein [Rhodobacterales bacterium]
MKPIFPILALAMLLPAGAALADVDDCRAPAGSWQPRQAVMDLAAIKGWTLSDFEIDDGCYEIEGRDTNGRRFEAKLDPATLEIVKMEGRKDMDRRRRMDPAPAGTVAPPADGLFGNGAPTVVVQP